MSALVRTEAGEDGVFRITLSGPRANALEPTLLTELRAALNALEASGATRALLSGGRNFSSGGDVARFYAAARSGEAETYARQVVPLLQECVTRMIAMPVIFGLAARGAVTGGAAGLLFASDLAVVAPDAFVQPYYGAVGFAPDGGWAALLPELIGVAPAQNWLHVNRRVDAPGLCALGLAQSVSDAPEDAALHQLARLNIQTALASKRLIWNASRQAALRAGLDAETSAFLDLIARPETLDGMAQFLKPTREDADV